MRAKKLLLLIALFLMAGTMVISCGPVGGGETPGAGTNAVEDPYAVDGVANVAVYGTNAIGSTSDTNVNTSWSRSFDIYVASTNDILYLFFERTDQGFDDSHNFMVHLDNNNDAFGPIITNDFTWNNTHSVDSTSVATIEYSVFDNYKVDATFTNGYTWSNVVIAAVPATVGVSTTGDSNTGNEGAGTSAGTYIGTVDGTITVEVITAGASGVAEVEVTTADGVVSTNTVTSGTPFSVGDGVTLTIDISNATAPVDASIDAVGTPDVGNGGDEGNGAGSIASSYTGVTGTFRINVACGGPMNGSSSMVSVNFDDGGGYVACSARTPTDGVPFNLGETGSQFTLTDGGSPAGLTYGDIWTIGVTAAIPAIPAELTLGDTWTIAVTAAIPSYTSPSVIATNAPVVAIDSGGDIEMAIPYADLKATAGDTLDLYLLYVGANEIHCAFPDPSSATGVSDQTVAITLN